MDRLTSVSLNQIRSNDKIIPYLKLVFTLAQTHYQVDNIA